MKRKNFILLCLLGIIPLGIGYLILPSLVGERLTWNKGLLKRPVLPRYYPNVNGFESEHTYLREGKRGRPDTLWHAIPPFTFTDQTGETVTEAYMDGNITIANFFFASCPGVCPVMNKALAGVRERLEANTKVSFDDVVFLSHTVDPDRDTTAVLNKYAEKFNAKPNQWKFVTGNKDDLYDLSMEGYFMTAQKAPVGAAEEFDHSGKLVLVDKNRVIRGYYSALDSARVNKLVEDIYILKLEYPNPKTNVQYRYEMENKK